jgi:hypothetical protein
MHEIGNNPCFLTFDGLERVKKLIYTERDAPAAGAQTY